MEDYRREIREALDAGHRALDSLYQARNHLESAGNWGWLDMFGGNFFTGMMKHSKISDAQQCIQQAAWDLQQFQRELQDVGGYLPYLEMGDFLTFADFFFDGFVADFMVQSKIQDAKGQLDQAIWQVEGMVDRLSRQLG